MAALADNKYDVYKWIIKVIDSCKNPHHFRAARNLVTNFHDRYDDWELTGELRIYESDKYFNRKR